MDRTFRRRGEGERGQVLVIVAGGALTLLLLLGLVIDGGIAVFNRRDGQNIADIAALAGARGIADYYRQGTTPDTYDVIDAVVTANGCGGTVVPCEWDAWYVGAGASGPQDIAKLPDAPTGPVAPPSGTLGVRVQVFRQPTTFLASLAGIDHWNVTTEGTAIAYEPRMAPSLGLLPIALKEDPGGYDPFQVYDLTDGKDAPGGFGYISWTGSNDPNALSNSLCYPDNPEFYLPKVFVADPGKSNADDVRACLAKWITSGQTVLIPIYDIVTGTGNNATYNIVGVAAFVITAQEQPAVDNIRGYFLEVYPYTDPVPGGSGTQPPTPDSTSYSLQLVR